MQSFYEEISSKWRHYFFGVHKRFWRHQLVLEIKNDFKPVKSFWSPRTRNLRSKAPVMGGSRLVLLVACHHSNFKHILDDWWKFEHYVGVCCKYRLGLCKWLFISTQSPIHPKFLQTTIWHVCDTRFLNILYVLSPT